MRRHLLPLVCLAGALSGCGAGLSGGAAPVGPVHRTHSGAHRRVFTRLDASLQSAQVHFRDQVVILMFHGLGRRAHGDIITPKGFAAELQAMRRAGLQFVSLSQVAQFLSGRAPLPPNAVAITFDDGLASVYTYAYPALERARVPFACFLVAGRVGRDPADLSWTEVQAMERSGLATFGSHTMASHGAVPTGPGRSGAALVSHIYYAATGSVESPAAFRKRVLRDLETSRTLISAEIRRPVHWFAYPFGAYDPAVEQLLQTAGYRYAVTTWGWGTTGFARPLALPRINVGTPRTNGGTIVGTVLYIARLTKGRPRLQPPATYDPVWR